MREEEEEESERRRAGKRRRMREKWHRQRRAEKANRGEVFKAEKISLEQGY